MEHGYKGLTEDGRWAYGGLVDGIYIVSGLTDLGNYYMCCPDQVRPETVGRWTGHKDWYIGDYLGVVGGSKRKYEIVWDQERFSIMAKCLTYNSVNNIRNTKNLERIGNKWEK